MEYYLFAPCEHKPLLANGSGLFDKMFSKVTFSIGDRPIETRYVMDEDTIPKGLSPLAKQLYCMEEVEKRRREDEQKERAGQKVDTTSGIK